MAGTKALGSIEKFWPMGDVVEKKAAAPSFTKEQYDAIMARHKIKVK
jgi:hypothetical protein